MIVKAVNEVVRVLCFTRQHNFIYKSNSCHPTKAKQEKKMSRWSWKVKRYVLYKKERLKASFLVTKDEIKRMTKKLIIKHGRNSLANDPIYDGRHFQNKRGNELLKWMILSLELNLMKPSLKSSQNIWNMWRSSSFDAVQHNKKRTVK